MGIVSTGRTVTGFVALGGALVMAFLPDALPTAVREPFSRVGVLIGLLIMLVAFFPLLKRIPSALRRSFHWVISLRFRSPVYRASKTKQDEPVIPLVKDKPRTEVKLASKETMERLREAFRPARHAFRYAYEYFLVDVMGLSGEGNGFAARLLKEYTLPEFEKATGRLEAGVSREDLPTEEEFEALIGEFSKTIGLYYRFLEILLGAAELFTGSLEDLLAKVGYRQLYERHQKFHAEMERIKGRRDIGRVAFNVARFDKFLPPPRLAPAGSPPDSPVTFRLGPGAHPLLGGSNVYFLAAEIDGSAITEVEVALTLELDNSDTNSTHLLGIEIDVLDPAGNPAPKSWSGDFAMVDRQLNSPVDWQRLRLEGRSLRQVEFNGRIHLPAEVRNRALSESGWIVRVSLESQDNPKWWRDFPVEELRDQF